jgi:hypothetical protein
VKKGDVSYGNKTAYQHHAAWFASNGYVCLVIDTLQLGEIEGIHHGHLPREHVVVALARVHAGGRRGVELRPRAGLPPVAQGSRRQPPRRHRALRRRGVQLVGHRHRRPHQGRRPVAGITDLHNHVVDGSVEGHCDCMFFVNTYRWDYPTVAALAAPRPLLITNTDKDSIFPYDGVSRLYWKVRGVYGLGKQTTRTTRSRPTGPADQRGRARRYSPELQVAAFRWFNRYLKGEDKPIDLSPAKKLIEPEQLRCFKEGLPQRRDQRARARHVRADGARRRRCPSRSRLGEAARRLDEGVKG